jgi:hypothetical protein
VITPVNDAEGKTGAIVRLFELKHLKDPLVAADDHGSPIRGTCEATGKDIRLGHLQLHCRVVKDAQTAILKRHQERWYLRVGAEDHRVDPVVRNVGLARAEKLQVECVPYEDRMYAVPDSKEDLIGSRKEADTGWWVGWNGRWQSRVTVGLSITSNVLP